MCHVRKFLNKAIDRFLLYLVTQNLGVSIRKYCGRFLPQSFAYWNRLTHAFSLSENAHSQFFLIDDFFVKK